MVTIARSGGRSVVGNSRVEEHLSKEAQSAVFDLQQHSQEPANYASKKLEVCVCVCHVVQQQTVVLLHLNPQLLHSLQKSAHRQLVL